MKSSLIFSLLAFVFTSPLWATPDVRDGAWNGKPFTKQQIEKGVAAGHPDALAEWAYCSMLALDGIPYQPELIAERAEAAAKGGSPLGAYLRAHALHVADPRESETIVKHLKKAQEVGHPLADWRLGAFHHTGSHGYPRDPEKSAKLIQKSLEAGALLALGSMAVHHLEGAMGEIDTDKALALYRRAFEEEDLLTAYLILSAQTGVRSGRPLKAEFNEAEVAQAFKILEDRAALNQPEALYYLGGHLMHLNRPHEAIPLLIKTTWAYESSHRTLILEGSRAMTKLFDPVCYACDVLTMRRQGRICYENGLTGKKIRRLAAMDYLGNGKERTPNEEKGIRMLLDLIEEAAHRDCTSSHDIAGHLTRRFYYDKECDRAVFERGMAHYQYHIRCASAAHWFASSYSEEDPRLLDVPKALASLNFAISLHQDIPVYLQRQKSLKKRLLNRATKEQIAQAEKLITDEWPQAARYRKAAFKKLQEIGDIPKELNFIPERRFPQQGQGL